MNRRSRLIRGQSAIEYLIGVSLVALALAAGPLSPLERLQTGLRDAWRSFSHALSRP
jgi:Flp pilus assembly pilin Flp